MNGADPNQRHPLGWTPLHVAAVQGNVDVVKILLKVSHKRCFVYNILYTSIILFLTPSVEPTQI